MLMLLQLLELLLVGSVVMRRREHRSWSLRDMVRLLCTRSGTEIPQSEALSEGSPARDGAARLLVCTTDAILVVDGRGRSLCLAVCVRSRRCGLLRLLGLVVHLLGGLLLLWLLMLLPLLVLLPTGRLVAVHMRLVLHSIASIRRLCRRSRLVASRDGLLIVHAALILSRVGLWCSTVDL